MKTKGGACTRLLQKVVEATREYLETWKPEKQPEAKSDPEDRPVAEELGAWQNSSAACTLHCTDSCYAGMHMLHSACALHAAAQRV